MAARHPLVTLGDSITQGFMGGAIHRTDIAYPVFVAEALGVRERFSVPTSFTGMGGLPVNLERLARLLEGRFGRSIDWWELLPAAARVREMLDHVEDHWERGRGSRPLDRPETYHNLAVWGFEVQDASALSEGIMRRALPPPRDQVLQQIPEMSMYRTGRLVLNPTFADAGAVATQVDRARQLGADGGIERLVVGYGANNALGTVLSLAIVDSEEPDLTRLRHERKANLYRPHHFETLYRRLASDLATVDARHVFLLTVPHVTIAPVTRGVSPGKKKPRDAQGYFEFYTRPWIWDDEFDPERHAALTRAQAKRIDATIDAYNDTIRRVAQEREWHVIDLAKLLDDLAFRRSGGQPSYRFPDGIVAALRRHPSLAYLVTTDDDVHLDTRFFVADRDHPGRVFRGGLFSLDGVHPTTIGYGLVADLVLDAMKKVGAADAGLEIPWDAVVAADTLVNRPPQLVDDLQRALNYLEKLGILRGIFDQLH